MADPAQQQEGPQQQQRGQRVVALRQRQPPEMAQQALAQQGWQGGQHAGPADGLGGGEFRSAPVEQPQTGRHPPRGVVRGAAQHGLRGAPTALFLADQFHRAGRRRDRRRALRSGRRERLASRLDRCAGGLGRAGGRPPRGPLAGRQQACFAVAPQRRAVHAQVLGHAIQTLPGLQLCPRLVEQFGGDDGVPPPRLARLRVAPLAVLLQAGLGTAHGARIEAEGVG